MQLSRDLTDFDRVYQSMYAKPNSLLKQNISVFKTCYVFCSLKNPLRKMLSEFLCKLMNDWN